MPESPDGAPSPLDGSPPDPGSAPGERPDGDSRFTYDELFRRRDRKPLRELPGLATEAVRLVWAAGRRELVVTLGLTVVAGAITVGQLLVARWLLGAVVELPGGRAWSSVLPALLGFVGLLSLGGAVQLGVGELRRILGELVARHSARLVAAAATQARLVDFEHPGFHDRLQRALANAGLRPLEITFALVTVANASVVTAGITVALAVVEPVLLGLALVSFVPVWLATRRLSRLSYAFELAETEADRRRTYLLWLLTGKQQAKEVRAFGLGPHFTERHDALWDERIGRLRRLARRRVSVGVAGQLVNGALFGLVVGALAWSLAEGRTSLADATVAAGAVLLLGGRLGQIVSGVGTLYESALFLGDVRTFLADAARRQAAPRPATVPGDLVELSVEGVSFRYPASSSWALRGVDVRVRTGEVVALVGANGSGKTTLAKVMADLFEPAGGVVRWNGEDLRRFDPRAVRERIAVIFQDFERYLFTAGENVTLGRVEAAGDRDRLEQAARRAGIADAIERLPHGYDTLLGPEFQGGTDVSGGQWQRLALARAFFRDAQLLILDEPSSALDPEAEAALFSRVRDLCDGRAVVVISHRFSTVTSADRIVVLDEGRVIESGSHRELLALDGTYARLFRLQAQQYLDDTAPRES